MGQINIWTAFVAGVLSFLSPCVLPLVPGYISFISGLSLEELSREGTASNTRQVLWRALLFVLGFSIVFTMLGASASAMGKFLAHYSILLSKIAGVIIILFGLHILGAIPIPWLYYEKKI